MKQDSNLDFNGMAGDGVNRGKDRFAKNQWSGHSNDGRTVNYGRGPIKGNDGTNTYKGAPTSATGTAQYRGVGGTTVKKPGEKIDFGRGPTKGNCGC
jgi:hypothetical protein